MKNHKIPDDFTAKYEQIRLRSKQRLIGGIVILMFALFLLLYVVAKIKPLSSHTTIIMKTKASDTEQLGIKQIVANSKADSSSSMIQVVSKQEVVKQQEENIAASAVRPVIKAESEVVESAIEKPEKTESEEVRKTASSVTLATRPHKKPLKNKVVKPVNKTLDPEAILNGHS